MKNEELAYYCLDSLSKAGCDKSEFLFVTSKRYEMNIAGGEMSLLRTTFDKKLDLTAIKDDKKGVISLNKTDEEALKEAVKNVMEIAENSEVDEANDISPMQPPNSFVFGDEEPDMDKMYVSFTKFLSSIKKSHPKINIMESILDFTHKYHYYANSNGTRLSSSKGNYNLQVVFTAKDGERSSSFNYTGFSARELDKELLECGSIGYLLNQSVEQLYTIPIEGKFTGDVIITPDCLMDVIRMYLNVYLEDMALISGTSILKDRLNEKVASSMLTIHSNPVSEEIADGYFITEDGFEAKNMTIIEKGILKSFMLSLYGAKKTLRERALNHGEALVVEPGEKSLDDIIKSVKKGIVVSRFSGGNPSKNGDFSGVAKNSYYVVDGEIKYPVSETMISGNLYEMFNNIIDISRERVNFGMAILPWVAASGITVSGK